MSEKKLVQRVALGIILALGMTGCSSINSAENETRKKVAAESPCLPNAEIKGNKACVSYEGGVRMVRFLSAKGTIFSVLTQNCSGGKLSNTVIGVDPVIHANQTELVQPFIAEPKCLDGSADREDGSALNDHITDDVRRIALPLTGVNNT